MVSPEHTPRSLTPRSIVATVLSVLVVFALGLVVALPARESFDAKQVAQTQGQDLASKVLAVCQEGGDGAAPLLAIGACPLAQQVRSMPLAAPPQGGLTAEQVQALIKEEVARALRQPSKQQAVGPPGPTGPPGVAGLPGRSTTPGPEQQPAPDNRVIEPPMVHEQAPNISEQPAPRYPQQQSERAPQQQPRRAPPQQSHWPAPHGRPSHDWPGQPRPPRQQPPHNWPPGQQQPPPYNRPPRQQPPYNPYPQQQQQRRPYNWPQQQQQQQPYNQPQQQQQPYQAPQQQQQQPQYNQQPRQQRMPSHQGSSLLTGVSGLLGGLGL